MKSSNINLHIDSKTIDEDFQRIADKLMNHWILKAGEEEYRITEIEFYVNNAGHEDDYTHMHDLQKTNGKWYFHGSGLDLTCGNENMYGGILLRAIWNINKKEEYHYGPLKLLTEIFSHLDSIYESEFSIGLVFDTNNKIEFEKPIAAPRVGLNPQKNPDMYENLYRYLVMPKYKHAEKTKIAEAMQKQKIDENEIKKIWG